MNCKNHEGIAAIGQCDICQCGLCSDCYNAYTTPTCGSCAENHNEAFVKSVYKEIAILLVGGILVFLVTNFISEQPNSPKLGLPVFFHIYFSFAVFVGWITLNKVQARHFSFIPLVGFVLFIVFKVALSFVVGIIYLPIWLIMAIRKIVKFSK